jgi:hypothetical protein
MVILDRRYPDGRRDRLEVPVRDVRRVEVDRPLGADDPCSAILLRTVDGGRLLFDDDRERDLGERGRRLARDMARPIEVAGAGD